MRVAALLCLGLALAGCQSTPPKPVAPELARFFLESADGQGELVTLPMSGVQISVQPKPVLTEYDIVNVELARVELGKCVMFQLTPAAARDLYRLTVANPGRRLVLTLGGVPFGARRIGPPIEHGTLLVFVETPDAALPALVISLKETCAALHPAAAKR
jgi:hypothetical protein